MLSLWARGRKLANEIDRSLLIQGDIAEQIGITGSHLSQIKSGRMPVSKKTAGKIAEYFRRETGYFFAFKVSKRKEFSNNRTRREG